jgi:CheY-like chemotaxis protein
MRIIQAISNLLNNAAKYTPDGGIIEISAWQDASSNRVSVTDTGVGIEQGALSGIFDLFTQVRQSGDLAMGGLGIGLSLVRKMVELHGGTATALSPGAGKGSTFTITLPRDQDVEDCAMTSQLENVATKIAPLRILIVDNNNDAAESLAAILKISGHTIKLAGDGVEALDIAATFTPEVVFLEIGLPDLDGYEVARAMRKLACTEQSTLIALTGWGAESDRSKSRAVGFDHHLTKPPQLEIIEGIMKCATNNPRRYLVR